MWVVARGSEPAGERAGKGRTDMEGLPDLGNEGGGGRRAGSRWCQERKGRRRDVEGDLTGAKLGAVPSMAAPGRERVGEVGSWRFGG